MSARKLVRRAQENGKVFGTKKSRKIQFSPGPQAKDDYVTPQMNHVLTLPRAPVKSFKKRNFPDDHTKELLSKKICRRPRKNRFPPQVLPYDDMRDDIDVAIDNIDNGENNPKYFRNEVLGIPMSNKKNTEQSASSKHILLDPLEDFSLEKNGFSSSNGRHEDYEKNVRAILNRFHGTKRSGGNIVEINNRTQRNNINCMSYSNGKEPTSGLSVEYKQKQFSLEPVAWIDSPSKAEEANEDDGSNSTTQGKNDKNHHDIMKCLFGDDED